MPKFDIVSIGSAIQDIFILSLDLDCVTAKICHPFRPNLIDKKINIKTMHLGTGGGGTNTAATFAHMRLNTALLSQIGNDSAGQEILKIMHKLNVNTDLIAINQKEETGYSVIFINPAGDKTALVFRGASEFKHFKPSLKTLKTDWFFISSLSGNLKLLKQLFHLAQKRQIKIAWNPGEQELNLPLTKIKPFLARTDVLILNLMEARDLTRTRSSQADTLLVKLSSLAKKSFLAVTAGSAGAWVKAPFKSTIYHASARRQKVVNTTGAGDAFGSGLVAGLILYSGDIKKSLALAMLNSGGVVTQMGAKHGLLAKPPTQKALKRIKINLI